MPSIAKNALQWLERECGLPEVSSTLSMPSPRLSRPGSRSHPLIVVFFFCFSHLSVEITNETRLYSKC